ncbi:hypothetical protein KI112_002563 [Enterococcus faecalis]|nr:hypothetical protein [Enterococcus faecalis]EHR4738404.1 hypothetical protein [Enterococcus faecalis]EJM6076918.1 hypothetical protein [Enterococcus faecalis]EKK0951553.1 hypothetical protein [Enterococcus faecalis]
MIAKKRLVLNNINYCLPSMACELIEQTKKYHTFRRIEKKKTIDFRVSNDLVSLFFCLEGMKDG